MAGPRRRSRAVRPSGSGSRPRSAAGSSGCSTCSTSRRSGSTRGTTGASWRTLRRPPGSRQHRARRRARRGDDPVGGSRHRSRAPGRTGRVERSSSTGRSTTCCATRRRSRAGTCAASCGSRPGSATTPARRGGRCAWRARASTTCGTSTSTFRSVLFVAVTGVSGSGKSTLVTDILYHALARHFYRAKVAPGSARRRSRGSTQIDKVLDIDQSPIGRTPRSNPATYTGLFTPIRDLFAQLPEAKLRGLRTRAVLLQREGRSLRVVPGRRPGQDRDALPAGRVRPVRRLQGATLQPGDPRRPVQGEVHRRRARHDRGGCAGVLRQPAPHRGTPRAAERRRAGVHPPGAERDHALRRRGAAGQAGDRALQAGHGPNTLYPRRADDRAPFRGRPVCCSTCCIGSWTRATR